MLESTTSKAQASREAPDESTTTVGPDNGDASAPGAPFTLQLVGVRDRSSLEALVSELDNRERYEIVSTTFEGEPWYVLTHGRYETVEAARSAIERLPEDFKRYSPWPRRVSDFDASAP
ncbi:MAG: SPOR domain-containing protein [Halofilum sp. (in: g-proteobacteria)]|nr:SPOR domain-containing protein [Halofilum sp. (in: g-proteobacteria)]